MPCCHWWLSCLTICKINYGKEIDVIVSSLSLSLSLVCVIIWLWLVACYFDFGALRCWILFRLLVLKLRSKLLINYFYFKMQILSEGQEEADSFRGTQYSYSCIEAISGISHIKLQVKILLSTFLAVCICRVYLICYICIAVWKIREAQQACSISRNTWPGSFREWDQW